MEWRLPTNSSRWCFATWPGVYAHTLDNPRAVFEEVKNDPTIEKVILRRRGQKPETSKIEGVNVRVVQIESLKGAWCVATSGRLLIGYGLSGLCSYARFISRKHHIIQLWHGIPLKRIAKLFDGETGWETETPLYAATVCSSAPDRSLMAQAFSPIPKERVWQTGLPRNSTLQKVESALPIDYREDLARLRRTLADRRFILYAPTWRNGSTGLYDFSDEEFAALNQFLVDEQLVLGIRAHANRRFADRSLGTNSIVFVNDFPDVNVILRLTDVLITDYSSIYIDYLLLDRPILHFTYDFAEYVRERGFLYAFEDAVPDHKITNFSALLSQLKDVLSRGLRDPERHHRVKQLFHDHPEESAKAVAKCIRELP